MCERQLRPDYIVAACSDARRSATLLDAFAERAGARGADLRGRRNGNAATHGHTDRHTPVAAGQRRHAQTRRLWQPHDALGGGGAPTGSGRLASKFASVMLQARAQGGGSQRRESSGARAGRKGAQPPRSNPSRASAGCGFHRAALTSPTNLMVRRLYTSCWFWLEPWMA